MIKWFVIVLVLSVRPHACGPFDFFQSKLSKAVRDTPGGHDELIEEPPMTLDDDPFDEDENLSSEAISDFVVMEMAGRKNWNYSAAEEMLLLRLHNEYRSNMSDPVPFMSNINYMEWDQALAQWAQLLADGCSYSRELPDSDMVTVSQNSYMGSSCKASRPVWKWYEEHMDYDFTSRKCIPDDEGAGCYHYEKMAFHSNTKVGCGRALCAPRDEMYMTVCLYYPKPSRLDQMFHYGQPCNQCDRGKSGSLCHGTLCVTEEICRSNNLTCECKLECKNCGKFNATRCSCDCFPGWDANDCGTLCRDSNPTCGKIGGITQRECYQNQEVRTRSCRSFCHQCRKVKRSMKVSELCCTGKLCNPGYSLDENTCECTLDCPGKYCMFNSTPIFAASGPRASASKNEPSGLAIFVLALSSLTCLAFVIRYRILEVIPSL